VSTICVAQNIEAALCCGADHIELCGLACDSWRSAIAAVRERGIAIGLHSPVEFRGDLRSFGLTQSDPRARSTSRDAVRHSFDVAQRCDARYVVVHFPSIVLDATGRSRQEHDDLVDEAAAFLTRLGTQSAVEVLIENVEPNPFFCEWGDYVGLLSRYPVLKLCLDIGHVHSVRGEACAVEFSRCVSEFVRGAHLYNTAAWGSDRGRHVDPLREGLVSNCWMDLERHNRDLLKSCDLKYVTLEYRFDPAASLAKSLDWVRSTLRT
jgi:sugar phosphate isomerase/epimerase